MNLTIDQLIRQYNKERGIIQAMWCRDSETGNECLVDVAENKVIARRVNGRIVDPGEAHGKD